MEKKRITVNNSIGMFDLFKGLAMITVVFFHCFGSVLSFSHAITNMIAAVALTLSTFVMEGFFMVSGYGFRKRTTKQCLCYQVDAFLKPYLYTMVGIAAFRFITRYLLSRSVGRAFRVAWASIGGFLLGLPDAAMINGMLFYSCAPMWYLFALAIAWVLLNTIMLKLPEKLWTPAVVVITCIGLWIGWYCDLWFCLSRGMVNLSYVYIGYLMKKKKLLFGGWFKKYWPLMAAGCFCISFGWLFPSESDSILEVFLIGDLLYTFFAGFGAMMCLYLTQWLSQFSGRINGGIRWVGANSLYILALHAVVWRGVSEELREYVSASNTDLVCWADFAFQWVFILVGTALIKKIKKHQCYKKVGV